MDLSRDPVAGGLAGREGRGILVSIVLGAGGVELTDCLSLSLRSGSCRLFQNLTSWPPSKTNLGLWHTFAKEHLIPSVSFRDTGWKKWLKYRISWLISHQCCKHGENFAVRQTKPLRFSNTQ